MDDIRVAIVAGNVERVADLTRFLVTVASPELLDKEREKLHLPSVIIGRDRDGRQRAEALEACHQVVENVLRLLKGRGIFAAMPIPDGGKLTPTDEEGE